jgi:hypothetical protein
MSLPGEFDVVPGPYLTGNGPVWGNGYFIPADGVPVVSGTFARVAYRPGLSSTGGQYGWREETSSDPLARFFETMRYSHDVGPGPDNKSMNIVVNDDGTYSVNGYAGTGTMVYLSLDDEISRWDNSAVYGEARTQVSLNGNALSRPGEMKYDIQSTFPVPDNFGTLTRLYGRWRITNSQNLDPDRLTLRVIMTRRRNKHTWITRAARKPRTGVYTGEGSEVDTSSTGSVTSSTNNTYSKPIPDSSASRVDQWGDITMNNPTAWANFAWVHYRSIAITANHSMLWRVRCRTKGSFAVRINVTGESQYDVDVEDGFSAEFFSSPSASKSFSIASAVDKQGKAVSTKLFTIEAKVRVGWIPGSVAPAVSGGIYYLRRETVTVQTVSSSSNDDIVPDINGERNRIQITEFQIIHRPSLAINYTGGNGSNGGGYRTIENSDTSTVILNSVTEYNVNLPTTYSPLAAVGVAVKNLPDPQGEIVDEEIVELTADDFERISGGTFDGQLAVKEGSAIDKLPPDDDTSWHLDHAMVIITPP